MVVIHRPNHVSAQPHHGTNLFTEHSSVELEVRVAGDIEGHLGHGGPYGIQETIRLVDRSILFG